ncbi:MAG: metallophosphoesterase family protein [Bacteroides sp.]|nr:metallophosphoesterase family protein [Bacteroidales bacterium]MBD5316653.1 metallophosphoesterase family protein [Bacteroides sp.]MBD5377595.1 metallophosphoesterase family protein [Bacteroides sp.]
MKRIGILSDTHSCWDDRFARHFRDCDEVWHAGDVGCIDVIRRLEEVVPVVRAVRGNIDHGDVARAFPEVLTWECEGLRCLMTHIGGYPGRYAPGIPQLLRQSGARLFIAGHSHILKVMNDPLTGCLHINPGAAGHHGWQKERTLVRLTIDHATPQELEVIELGKFKV